MNKSENHNIKPVKRVEINLGYTCNNNCLFCGEGENRRRFQAAVKSMLSTEQVKADITSFSNSGYNHITFLGGEPTIRKDFPEIIEFASSLGFNTVFLTTNGRLLSNKKYAEAVFRRGLTEVCLSLHGATAETHDHLTRAAGSFDQTMTAMNNLADLGRQFSISTVISKTNHSELPDMVRLLAPYHPRRILMSYPIITGSAYEYFNAVIARFTDSAQHVMDAIEVAKAASLMITVGHVPFCVLPGYEGYADILYWCSDIKRMVKKYRSRDNLSDGAIMDYHGRSKQKHSVCRKCKFYYLCEGLDYRYSEGYGKDELQAVPGEKIKDAELLKSRTHFNDSIDVPLEQD